MKTREVRLSEILRPIRRTVVLEPFHEYRLLGIRWYGGGLFEKAVLQGHEIKADKLFEVSPGDFVYSRLFAWKGSFAAAGPDHAGCYVSGEFPTFETDDSVDAEYLALCMRRPSYWDVALERSSGSTPTSRNRLKEEAFLRLTVPLPDAGEQRRIVGAAKHAMALCDEAERLQGTSSALSEKLWPAMAGERLEALPVPRVPLGEIVELRGGGTPTKSEPRYWQNGTVPWITPKDMKTPTLETATILITELAANTTAARVLDAGAVLVVVRGMILARHVPVSVLRVPAAVNQDMKALIPREGRVSPEYLASALQAMNSGLLDLVERSTHDTRKLRTDRLMAFPIPLPPLEVQHRVAEDLELLRQKLDAVRWISGQNEKLLRTIPGAVVHELLPTSSLPC